MSLPSPGKQPVVRDEKLLYTNLRRIHAVDAKTIPETEAR